jgi:hypothetical protein
MLKRKVYPESVTLVERTFHFDTAPAVFDYPLDHVQAYARALDVGVQALEHAKYTRLNGYARERRLANVTNGPSCSPYNPQVRPVTKGEMATESGVFEPLENRGGRNLIS